MEDVNRHMCYTSMQTKEQQSIYETSQTVSELV